MDGLEPEVSRYRKLFWTLGILCAVLFLLVIGIIVRNYFDNSGDGEINEAEEQTGLEAEISMAESIDEAIGIYEKYLDVAKNDEERVEILNQRVDYIMQNDDKKAYSEQALEDVIAIDGILKTVSSAAQVANTADDLGNTDVLKKYEKIADERSEAEGDNLDDQANG